MLLEHSYLIRANALKAQLCSLVHLAVGCNPFLTTSFVKTAAYSNNRSVLNAGIYSGTKFGIRGTSRTGHLSSSIVCLLNSGISLSLHDEISPLGLRSICAEPGYFRISLLSSGHRASQVPRILDYKYITSESNAAFDGT